MSIVRFENVSLAYGLKPLLQDVTFAIEPGEKLCLLGRNGEGKSSLMSLLCGEQQADSGTIIFENQLKVGLLPQDLPPADEHTVFEVVSEGAPEVAELLREFERLSHHHDAKSVNRLAQLQDQIEACDGWNYKTRVQQILKRFGLSEETRMSTLSGGWRRRVLLARALVDSPDLLLLDEPTNHLDINTIRWLEEQLKEFSGAVLFVSHDRAFIRALAAGIIELDRGHLRAFRGSYEDYLRDKKKQLEEEAKQNALFDKRLSQEETWIRQGIKARRTRNEGRVRALKAMREERRARLERQGTSQLKIESAAVSGKQVIEAQNITHAFDDGRVVIRDFSTTIMRGDRVGLIGVNGAGKTTLMRILLGKLSPAEGKVKLGTKLQIAYFDQLREGLDPENTVFENVADGHDHVDLGGQPRHVMSYLNDFLFTAERARTPVKALSGGETNRLLLARLFAKPANVIVLDEPTNDLDVETLELLEERLAEFDGTILLTSHDRSFLDEVVTSTLVFEGQGRIGEYVGGFSDWVRQTGGQLADESTFAQAGANDLAEVQNKPAEAKPEPVASRPFRAKKLSYKLQRELDQLPQLIDDLEANVAGLQEQLADPAFFQQERDKIEEVTGALAKAEEQLAEAMDRWVELSEMAEGAE